MTKNYLLKIPKNISILYSKKHQSILIKGPSSQKIIKLKTKIKVKKNHSLIDIKDTFFKSKSIKDLKNKKSIQGTNFSLIKQGIFEVSKKVFVKLKLNGIGYKIDIINKKLFKIIRFKLGLSHFIYFKIPNTIEITCYNNNNKLLIIGNNYNLVTNVASKIRSFKIPEVYKGKGILYENEVIKLKEGKKV